MLLLQGCGGSLERNGGRPPPAAAARSCSPSCGNDGGGWPGTAGCGREPAGPVHQPAQHVHAQLQAGALCRGGAVGAPGRVGGCMRACQGAVVGCGCWPCAKEDMRMSCTRPGSLTRKRRRRDTGICLRAVHSLTRKRMHALPQAAPRRAALARAGAGAPPALPAGRHQPPPAAGLLHPAAGGLALGGGSGRRRGWGGTLLRCCTWQRLQSAAEREKNGQPGLSPGLAQYNAPFAPCPRPSRQARGSVPWAPPSPRSCWRGQRCPGPQPRPQPRLQLVLFRRRAWLLLPNCCPMKV